MMGLGQLGSIITNKNNKLTAILSDIGQST